jgi:hypothetical protein
MVKTLVQNNTKPEKKTEKNKISKQKLKEEKV